MFEYGWIVDVTKVRFVRRYPCCWQRSAGAWVWEIEGDGFSVGSAWPAKECLKAKEWLLGLNGDITPR